jgi:hypothetical protein
MSLHIVGVHGIGNHQSGTSADKAASLISRRWTTALRRGLGAQAPVKVRVAYYAHHLTTDVSQGTGDPEHLSPEEQQLLLDWAANLGAPCEVAQGRLTVPARQAADWIARRFGLDHRLVRLLVTAFCREVHTYLSDDHKRRATQDELAATITEQRTDIVIAHSLGSVVAFETLWAHPDIKAELLLTLGSPLAMPDVIFPKLRPVPVDNLGHRPPGVRRWINIADPGDFVAIPRGLASYFNGVSADLTTPIAVFDMHKATNYLACPTTAAALAGTGTW